MVLEGSEIRISETQIAKQFVVFETPNALKSSQEISLHSIS